MEPDVSWGNGMGCPSKVVHCCADLQSMHGFRCYDTITPNAKCHRVLVLALALVDMVFVAFNSFAVVSNFDIAQAAITCHVVGCYMHVQRV